MKSNWGKVGHSFSHAAITRRLSVFIPVGLSRGSSGLLTGYSPAVGQKQRRSRLEFYFDGNFVESRASLKGKRGGNLNGHYMISSDKEPQFVVCFLTNFRFWSDVRILSTEISMHSATRTLDVMCDRHILGRQHFSLLLLVNS